MKTKPQLRAEFKSLCAAASFGKALNYRQRSRALKASALHYKTLNLSFERKSTYEPRKDDTDA